MDPLLEIRVVHAADAEAAEAAGADRLLVVAVPDGSSGGRSGGWSGGMAGGVAPADAARSPEPALVSSLCRSSDIPVRVLLRLDDRETTTGAGLVRLAGLASDYLAAGAEGLVYGFLDSDLEIDTELCAELADRTRAPWTFSRVFDRVLDPRRAWRQVRQLPGLDGVLTAGAALGATQGHEALLALAASDPAAARLTIAAGGVQAEHVPWLVRAGIRRLHLGTAVRLGGSWTKAHTDAALVRSWRLLLDDALERVRTA
jgi:copper homeostasis protein